MTRRLFACLAAALLASPVLAADPPAAPAAAEKVIGAATFQQVAAEVNEKVVKVFGSGGFRGVTNYSTGIVISPDGYILTVASQTLDTSELIIHMADGKRMKAAVVVTEPLLDVALVKIKVDGKKSDEPNGLKLPFFDVVEAAKRAPAETGDWALAFSNLFEIAMRDEPVSVQQGTIMSLAKLHGRRGIFDFPYTGEVYVVDAITNGPGAGGGPLTDRRGRLLGLIGREIKNSLTETWINYAIPLFAKVEVKDGDKTTVVAMTDFVDKGMKGQYKPVVTVKQAAGLGGYTGIKFVPNVLDRTPPYIDELYPDSPAAKQGLMVNDLVSFIDGEPIYSIKSYQEFMSRTRPGGVVRMEVRRGDNLQTVELKLDEWPKGMLKPALPPPSTGTEPKK